MVSGLLSLNVHEPLQFEGTEVCLHPDIFQQSATSRPSLAGNSIGGGASVSGNSIVTRGGGGGPIHVSSSASLNDNKSHIVPHSPPPPPPPNTDDARHLKVGDMIEIRVWDPLGDARTNQQQQQQGARNTPMSSSSLIRKRQPPPSSTTGSVHVAASSSADSIPGVDDATPGQALSSGSINQGNVPTLAPRKNPLESPEEFSEQAKKQHQYQMMEQQHRQIGEGAIGPSLSSDAGDAARQALSAGSRPPVVPRGKSSSSNVGASSSGSSLPLQVPRNAEPPPAPSLPPPVQPSGSNDSTNRIERVSPKTRHSRDVSDMTTDTTLFAGLEDLKQSVEGMMGSSNAKSFMDSPTEEDDDDDFWTQISSTHNLRLSFVMLVTEKSLKSLKASSRTHISILRQVADLYKLSSFDMVTVHKLVGREAEKALQAVSADFVVLTIKDQYLSRGDLHFFQSALIGSWIYEGQRLFDASRGIHANAREIRHGGAHASSGIVTDSTKIAFRSRSSRIFWLIQLSAEMWDFASPFQAKTESYCEVYFDKFISFVYGLFEKWKQAEVTHSLTIVFFSRTFLTPDPSSRADQDSSYQRDIYGRQYEDHCRMVIENETRPDWDSLIVRIKEAFLRYPSEVGWNCISGAGARRPSTAGQGNLLEAINVTLNLLQYHYLDRDLHRTGNSVVIVSAGNGVFEVDKKLATITCQRMMDNGIGSDMLSLGLPPLHIAPFFLYFNEFQEVESEIPHWMHLSFVSYESDENLVTLNDTGVLGPEQNVVTGAEYEPPLDIGPNGFLRTRQAKKPATAPERKVAEITAKDISKKTFSPSGNKAASPEKRTAQVKERQLGDRDFRDILEACRPRGTGLLPKALRSLLEMYRVGEKEDATKDSPLAEEGAETTIREWDDVNLDDVKKGKPLLFATRERKEQSSPLLTPMSPPKIDELDRLESGSAHSSSFTSQVPHSFMLGASYERHMLAQDASNTTRGAKMQRAPSLGIDFSSFNEREKGDARTSESTSDRSHHSSEDDSSLLEWMRSQMEKHDRDKLLPMEKTPPPGAHAELDRSTHSALLQQAQTPSRAQGTSLSSQGSHVGGIGAALSRYSGPTPDSEHSGLSRTASTGRIAPSLLRISELAPQGLSPLVLPPPSRASVSSLGDNPFVPGLGSHDRRFLRPQDLARPIQEDSQTVTPPQAISLFSSSPESHVSRQPLNDTDSSQKTQVTRRPASPNDSKLVRTRPRSGSGSGGHQAVFESSEASRRASPSPDTRVHRRPRSGSGGKSSSAQPPVSNRGATKLHDQNANSKYGATRRRKPINPFRQQDEDEILARKSHNSRRWSHVFPLGEIEFKKKSGPNWKSLSAPAILPLTVDFFPPAWEREHNFTFSLYNVSLSEFERNNFSSNKELLLEMVRQRITQDYQFVPSSLVDDTEENGRRTSSGQESLANAVRMYLSIGHRLQVLHYNPGSDTVEVKTYMAKNAQGNHVGTFKYFYKGFCQETGEFVKLVQDFKQYNSPYNWNKVDRIICGDEDREMREGMRFKRLMFAILPDKHPSAESEKSYVEKFHKLLEYFEKLRAKEETNIPLSVKIVTSQSEKAEEAIVSTPGIAGKSMVRFYVPLRKGGREQFEYLEISIDSTLNTNWSYRIIFNWLVAGSNKVDTQIQLLQRRCNQFGLRLVPSLEISVSKTLFLNPFKAPAIYTIRDIQNVIALDEQLEAMDFIHDGVFLSSRDFVDCIENASQFDFGKKWGKPPEGRQVIHRSGLVFVRIVEDRNGKAVVFAFGNYQYIKKDDGVREKCKNLFSELSNCLERLSN